MLKFSVVNHSDSISEYEYETIFDEDFVNAQSLELEEDEVFSVSSDDLREWQLANTGMTESDLPYSMRTVSII